VLLLGCDASLSWRYRKTKCQEFHMSCLILKLKTERSYETSWERSHIDTASRHKIFKFYEFWFLLEKVENLNLSMYVVWIDKMILHSQKSFEAVCCDKAFVFHLDFFYELACVRPPITVFRRAINVIGYFLLRPRRNSQTWGSAASFLRFLDHTQSIGLLWTGDRPDADLLTYTLTRDRHPCLGRV
jgi:hypothetical protein